MKENEKNNSLGVMRKRAKGALADGFAGRDDVGIRLLESTSLSWLE